MITPNAQHLSPDKLPKTILRKLLWELGKRKTLGVGSCRYSRVSSAAGNVRERELASASSAAPLAFFRRVPMS